MRVRIFRGFARMDSSSAMSLDRRLVLLLELVALETRQAAKLHVQDGLGLQLGQAEALAQLADEELLLALVRADELDDRVDVVVGDLEALEDVRPLPRLGEVELGAPADDLAPVVDVVLQDLFQREDARSLVDEREHVEVERGLHRGVLEEVVQHAVRRVVALDLDDDAHAVAVALVADVADALQLLVLDQVRDLLDERRLVHRVRQLADDDGLAAALHVLFVGLRAHDDPATAVRVRAADAVDALDLSGLDVLVLFEAVDDPAAREVGSEDRLAEVVVRELGVLDEALLAATISRRLCGGMFVAIPTAMPAEPFTRRFGRRAGRTVGCWCRLS